MGAKSTSFVTGLCLLAHAGQFIPPFLMFDWNTELEVTGFAEEGAVFELQPNMTHPTQPLDKEC